MSAVSTSSIQNHSWEDNLRALFLFHRDGLLNDVDFNFPKAKTADERRVAIESNIGCFVAKYLPSHEPVTGKEERITEIFKRAMNSAVTKRADEMIQARREEIFRLHGLNALSTARWLSDDQKRQSKTELELRKSYLDDSRQQTPDERLRKEIALLGGME